MERYTWSSFDGSRENEIKEFLSKTVLHIFFALRTLNLKGKGLISKVGPSRERLLYHLTSQTWWCVKQALLMIHYTIVSCITMNCSCSYTIFTCYFQLRMRDFVWGTVFSYSRVLCLQGCIFSLDCLVCLHHKLLRSLIYHKPSETDFVYGFLVKYIILAVS